MDKDSKNQNTSIDQTNKAANKDLEKGNNTREVSSNHASNTEATTTVAMQQRAISANDIEDSENTQKQPQQDVVNKEQQSNQVSEDDLEYISDTSASVLIKPATGGRMIIYTLFLFIIATIVWANFALLEEITRGEGIVVPSSKIQIIQNLEGGILQKLYVEEGEVVTANQPLAQLDNTRFSSNFKEKSFEYLSELAKNARLIAELNGTKIKFPTELDKYPEYTDREQILYENRKQSFDTEKEILNKKVYQAQYEIDSAKAQLKFLVKSFQLAMNELDLTKPLVEEGVVSKVEILQLEQKVNDLDREKNLVELSIPKLEIVYQEAKARLNESTHAFREEITEELNETAVNLDQLEQNTISLGDQLKRTLIKSPMDGIIKKVYITTEGGVVQPGMSLIEIVPLEDNLLVEVQIQPKDIGFLIEGMPATVKLSAYDFAIYGGLKGVVEHISADTHKNEKGDSYYIVNIRTDNNFLQVAGKNLNIIPGMKGTVDIITGKKTFIDYILKPILRARQSSFTER